MSKEFDPRVSASIDLSETRESLTEVNGSRTSAEDTLLQKNMHYGHNLKPRNGFWKAVRYSTAGHTTVLLILGTLWSILVHYYGPKYDYGVSLIPSPARDSVEYERVTIDTNIYEQSDFIGQPRPEMDAAWDGLLKYQYQAVQPSELAGDHSVSLNDVTERVLIQLEAYHTLNCLDFVRKFAFRTYYNMTDTLANIQHFGKCLDRVRQTTMCYGDVSVSTYVWMEGHLMPFPNFRLAHECRNWDKIERWAEENKLPPLGDELLKHPTYGPTGIF